MSLHPYIAFLFLLLTISFGDLFGQSGTSQLERFEADFVKGCAPLTVNITTTDEFDPGLVRQFDYESDGILVFVNDKTHTYTSPGIDTIVQVIGADNLPEGKFDTLIVEVMEARPPEFTISNCEANGVFIDITDSYYDRFAIDYGDGSDPDTVTAISLEHIYTLQGTYDITVQGLFDDAATNCGVASQTITTVNNLQAGQLDRVEVLDANTIEVSFSNLNPNILYQLDVAQNGISNFVTETILDNTTTTYTMSGLDTRNNYYCFRITAVNPCDESRNLFSDIICSIALNVTAENLQNELDWRTSSNNVTAYAVHKNGSLLTNINNPNTTALTDPDVICQEIYLYQITATTHAGGVSVSEEQSITAISTEISPPINGVTIQVAGSALQLDWDDNNAGLYYIQRSDAGGSFIRVDSVTTNTFTDSQVDPDVEYCYRVTYQDECGNESEESEEVCLEVPSQVTIYFPTAFTPNGDGLNDVFTGKSDLVNSIEWRIFNRWGELIFFSTSLDEGWNGIYKGQPVQEGTYVYRAEFTDHLNNQLSQFGSFLLLRR